MDSPADRGLIGRLSALEGVYHVAYVAARGSPNRGGGVTYAYHRGAVRGSGQRNQTLARRPFFGQIGRKQGGEAAVKGRMARALK